jgi:TonB family protein
VIAQVWVAADGSAENVKIVRTPSPDLANAAIRTVRNSRFKPARNFQGELIPVVVDVAVSFRLNAIPGPATSAASATTMSKKF